jgi:hypothetical protein
MKGEEPETRSFLFVILDRTTQLELMCCAESLSSCSQSINSGVSIELMTT